MQSDTGNIPLRKRAGGAFVQTGNKEYVEVKESNKKTKNTCKQRTKKTSIKRKKKQKHKIMCENHNHCTV